MSPTLYKFGNARVVMYPKDHKPPHVHVISPEGEAKFDIQTFECLFVRGFSKKDIRRMKEFLSARKKNLMEAWDDYQA
jgi:hypothetical protein